MKLTGVVAKEANNGIGVSATNSMPWPYDKQDMAFFRKTTLDNVMIMGYKTWESIGGRALPDRMHVIITNKPQPLMVSELGDVVYVGGDRDNPAFAEYVLSIIDTMYPDKEKFVIGGAKTFLQFAAFFTDFLVTEFDAAYESDVKFDTDILIGMEKTELQRIDNGTIYHYTA